MKPHVSVITLGVEDITRGEELLWRWPGLAGRVSFNLDSGSTALGVYRWIALAWKVAASAAGEPFAAE
jgi:hypothetical protein